MGDSDGTYDFSKINELLDLLRQGYDFVTGSRMLGNIERSAMPPLHRYLGNPMLTMILNLFFGSNYSDVYCGLRAFTKEAYSVISPSSPGMEFNLELAINAAKAGLKVCELPVSLVPRVGGESKLSTFSDGWRSLRFMLLYSPTYLFLVPGAVLVFLGLAAMFLYATPLFDTAGSLISKAPGMAIGSVLVILGVQAASLGVYARTMSYLEGYGRNDGLFEKIYRGFSLERGLFAGVVIFGIGGGIGLYMFVMWLRRGYVLIENLGLAMCAITLLTVGAQIVFSSFYVGLLFFRRADNASRGGADGR
jgi:hypothetical protein